MRNVRVKTVSFVPSTECHLMNVEKNSLDRECDRLRCAGATQTRQKPELRSVTYLDYIFNVYLYLAVHNNTFVEPDQVIVWGDEARRPAMGRREVHTPGNAGILSSTAIRRAACSTIR